MTQIEDRFHYLAADYSATGEGRTISLMITLLEPSDSEYSRKPSVTQGEDGKWKLDPGELSATNTEILTRQFAERFDEWWAVGMEVLTRADFFARFDNYVPKMAREMSREVVGEIPGNFAWHAQLHFNYS